jgi:hypothetical protein
VARTERSTIRVSRPQHNSRGFRFASSGYFLILAKVSGMSWSTVKAIINMRNDLSGMDRADLEACRQTYERLRTSTAQQVLRFHRMQQTAVPAA